MTEWTTGADNTAGISLLANADGWESEDLEMLEEILRPEFDVDERKTSLIQQAGWIPYLVVGLGIFFHPFVKGFLDEAGRDTYRELKEFLVQKYEEFSQEDGFEFLKIHLNGEYRGTTVSVAFNARSQEGLVDGLNQIDQMMEVVDGVIDGNPEQEIEVLSVIYWEAEGRWTFNHAFLSNGTDLRGEYNPNPWDG